MGNNVYLLYLYPRNVECHLVIVYIFTVKLERPVQREIVVAAKLANTI